MILGFFGFEALDLCMNKNLLCKIEQLKKLATVQCVRSELSTVPRAALTDSLSKVVYTKKYADIFMAELEAIVKHSK